MPRIWNSLAAGTNRTPVQRTESTDETLPEGGGGGLNNVVEDLSPQLGADLDVNGFDIVSVSNGDIDILPDGTGTVTVGNTGHIELGEGSQSTTYDLYPLTDVKFNLGRSSFRFQNAYAVNFVRGHTDVTAASYTVLSTDSIILADATSNAITITLPAASDLSGRTLDIKKTDSTANSVTIDGDGSETIDGQTTAVIGSQYDSLTIYSDGVEWWIL